MRKRYEQNIYVPEYLEEVFDFPDGNCSLYHRGCKIGIGFKKTAGKSAVHLFWIKLRDLARFGSAWQAKIAALSLASPFRRTNTWSYPFLRS